MFLIDTNVISALRKPERNLEVAAWVAWVGGEELYLSAISVMELQRGVDRLRARDAKQARVLARWLNAVLGEYDDRILPVTVPIARRWGSLAHKIGASGFDLAIAATALEHGLTVATRNISHFTPTGVPTVDPFAR